MSSNTGRVRESLWFFFTTGDGRLQKKIHLFEIDYKRIKFSTYRNDQVWVDQMVPWVKTLGMPNELNLILRSHKMEGENQLPQIIL